MRHFVIVDLEATCGWIGENRQSEIIEIGAVKVNEKLEIIDEFQSFIRPVINPELTEFCTKLTTITQADVDNAETFETVMPKFYEWAFDVRRSENDYTWTADSDVWFCSWGFYDKKMILQDMSNWKHMYATFASIMNNHISIKHQHGAIMAREMREQGIPKSQYKHVARGIGMNKALDMFGLQLDGTHHRGIDDARNITKLFIELYPQLKFE